MRIWSQCIKELSQFRRDRLTMALAIFLPLATLLIYGFAIRLEVTDIPLAVQDLDISPRSRQYIEQIFTTNQFRLVSGTTLSPSDAVDQGEAKAAVIIPPDFDRALTRGDTVTVQLLIDGSDANNARRIQNSLRATTNAFLQRMGLMPKQRLIETNTRLWFNPGRREALYIVPGVFGVILWIFPSLLSAIAMVREKERGTIVQVYASSLTAEEFLLGKGLAYLFVAIAQMVVVITLGCILFQVGFAGNPIPFFVGTLIYLSMSVMFGLFVGIRASNQNAAVQGVATIGFLTALLLSGFIYPLSNIPFPLSLFSNIVPARYYIELTRDAFVRGTGWLSVWWLIGILILLDVALFNIARRLIKRMQLPD